MVWKKHWEPKCGHQCYEKRVTQKVYQQKKQKGRGCCSVVAYRKFRIQSFASPVKSIRREVMWKTSAWHPGESVPVRGDPERPMIGVHTDSFVCSKWPSQLLSTSRWQPWLWIWHVMREVMRVSPRWCISHQNSRSNLISTHWGLALARTTFEYLGTINIQLWSGFEAGWIRSSTPSQASLFFSLPISFQISFCLKLQRDKN